MNQSEIIYPTRYQLHNSKKLLFMVLPRPLGTLTIYKASLIVTVLSFHGLKSRKTHNFVKTQRFALVEVSLNLCN